MIEDKIYQYWNTYNASPEFIKNLIGRIYRRIPLTIRYGSVYKEYYDLLKSSSYWNKDLIQSYVIARFNRILRIALSNTRFYPAHYEAKDIEIKSLKDIESLPLISKEHIRNYKADFMNKTIADNKLLYVTTGGTSGIPTELFWVKGRERSRELAFMTRLWERVGYNMSKKLAVIRGNVVDYHGRNKYTSYDPIKNRLFLSVYHLRDNTLPIYADTLLKFSPQYIHTYPSAITILAKYFKKNNLRLPGLKGVLCSSESFYPGQRELIEQAFGARVFSWYGHSEMTTLAGECEHSADYHVFFEYGHFELVDEKGIVIEEPNVRGEIVGTSFEMISMPMIRYRTGDYAEYVKGTCKCGRSYKLITNIKGRWTQEQIVTKDRNLVSITALNMHNDVFDNVEQYQFHQKRSGELFLRIIKKKTYTSSDEDKIRKALALKLRDFVDLKFEYVPYIQRTERGKHRFLIQELPVENK